MDKLTTKTLTALAKTANAAADEARAHAKSSVEHAIKSGAALNEAKSQCGHGEWTGWLDDNFMYSARSAANFMKLAAADVDTIGDSSSVRQALLAVSSSEPTRKRSDQISSTAANLETTQENGPQSTRKQDEPEPDGFAEGMENPEPAGEYEDVTDEPEPEPPKPEPPTRAEQASKIKSAIKQHNAAMMRLVDDLMLVSDNKVLHKIIHEAFRAIHKAIEGWK